MRFPLLEVGQSVLVASAPDDAPWRMIVDVVQSGWEVDRSTPAEGRAAKGTGGKTRGHVTLATPDDEELPTEWRDLTDVHLTSLDRFSVSDFAVPVVRLGTTRLVVGEPDASTPVQRRAYARVFHEVPASGMVLLDGDNRWVPFDPDVRDLGGGGCSLFADAPTPDGATIVISFALDENAPIVVVGRVLPHEVLPTIGRVLTRVEFVLLREVDRDRILRYVLLSLAGRRHGGRLMPS